MVGNKDVAWNQKVSLILIIFMCMKTNWDQFAVSILERLVSFGCGTRVGVKLGSSAREHQSFGAV